MSDDLGEQNYLNAIKALRHRDTRTEHEKTIDDLIRLVERHEKMIAGLEALLTTAKVALTANAVALKDAADLLARARSADAV